ncbi:MAG: hypothetical protein IPI85_12815 [Dehalococcoidia bacterium]|nr:hypothetical protein [Dehalococcoidia bacterium]
MGWFYLVFGHLGECFPDRNVVLTEDFETATHQAGAAFAGFLGAGLCPRLGALSGLFEEVRVAGLGSEETALLILGGLAEGLLIHAELTFVVHLGYQLWRNGRAVFVEEAEHVAEFVGRRVSVPTREVGLLHLFDAGRCLEPDRTPGTTADLG